MVGTSNESAPEMAIDISSANHPTPKVTPKLSHPETESEVISCQTLVLNVHVTCSIVCEFHSMVTYDRGKKYYKLMESTYGELHLLHFGFVVSIRIYRCQEAQGCQRCQGLEATWRDVARRGLASGGCIDCSALVVVSFVRSEFFQRFTLL